MPCPKGKIINPATKRCVNISGKIGQELVKSKPLAKPTKLKLPVKEIDPNEEIFGRIVESLVYSDSNAKLISKLNWFFQDKDISAHVRPSSKSTKFNGYEVLLYRELSEKNIIDLIGFFLELFLEAGDGLIESLAEVNTLIDHYAVVPIIVSNQISYKIKKLC